MDTPSSPPLTSFRETVKYISMDDMDEATRAFFAEHFFDFTGLETSGPASETLDTRFRTENADGLHDHEPQPRRFSIGWDFREGAMRRVKLQAVAAKPWRWALELPDHKRPVAIGARRSSDESIADAGNV
jgi:hypothetical protein